MSKLVSVIVPIYNVEKHLERCVQSIINQSYENLEIILVNDGSKDDSEKLCRQFENNDARVKVVSKENGGLSSARNAGIEVSTGEILSFVDGDDYIEKDMILNMVALMQKTDAQICVIGRNNFYEDSEKSFVDFSVEEDEVYDNLTAIKKILLKQDIDVSVCDKLFSRELFNEIRFPVGQTNEDCAIIFKLFLLAKNCAHAKGFGYYYCHRSGSITTSETPKSLGFLLNHAIEAKEYIKENAPGLIEYASVFSGRLAFYVYESAIKMQIKNNDKSFAKEVEVKAKEFIEQNYKVLSSKKYSSKSFRIKLMLIKTNLFRLATKVRG